MTKQEKIRQQGGDIRCEAISFQDFLDKEKVPVPAYLREDHCPWMGDDDVSVDRWISREFHQLEDAKMWSRTWQMACREEDIPEVGDHHVYDIVNRSAIVVRTGANEFKAFINSCLHRARTLCDQDGHGMEFKCPYHGFTWAIDGSFKGSPCPWDFKHLEGRDMRLPQIKVDTWGGFVFVNFDDNAPPLLEYLDVLPKHFERFPLADYYKAVHVQRVIPCNWKAGAEAFMESWHTVATHRQIMPFTGDCNSQYDCWGENVSRSVTPMVTPSPHLSDITEEKVMQDTLFYSGRMALDNPDGLALPEGMTAREYICELNRQMYGEACGEPLADATHAELVDAILYSAFPNFQIWIGYNGNIVYRFRPNGDQHESCIMDVMILLRYRKGEQPRPPAVPVHVVSEAEPWSSAAELGALGPVFDQDMSNMTVIQKGMKASRKGKVSLASYQEARIRHLHQTIDKYLMR